jgi:hypothetical protein
MSVQHRPDSIADHNEKVQKEQQIASAAPLMFVALSQQGAFDATTLAEHSTLFEPYVPGIGYAEGHIRIDAKHDGVLYKCITAHDAEHATDSPLSGSTLWQRIADPAEEFPDWFPATGVFDQWMDGDKVALAGKRWVSTVDNNVWEPGTTGAPWKEVK